MPPPKKYVGAPLREDYETAKEYRKFYSNWYYHNILKPKGEPRVRKRTKNLPSEKQQKPPGEWKRQGFKSPSAYRYWLAKQSRPAGEEKNPTDMKQILKSKEFTAKCEAEIAELVEYVEYYTVELDVENSTYLLKSEY